MHVKPEVDAWFAARDDPIRDARQRVCEVILGADDRVTESIKWKTPTFQYRRNIASFNPSKRFVSLLFHRGAEIPSSHPRLEGEGKLARTMRFVDLDDVDVGCGDLEEVTRAWCDWKDT